MTINDRTPLARMLASYRRASVAAWVAGWVVAGQGLLAQTRRSAPIWSSVRTG